MTYTLSPQLKHLNKDFTLGNCLFGYVKLATNADLDIYNYSGYNIRFDSFRIFFTDGTFGVDMSSSVHVENKDLYFYSTIDLNYIFLHQT